MLVQVEWDLLGLRGVDTQEDLKQIVSGFNSGKAATSRVRLRRDVLEGLDGVEHDGLVRDEVRVTLHSQRLDDPIHCLILDFPARIRLVIIQLCCCIEHKFTKCSYSFPPYLLIGLFHEYFTQH